MKGKKRYNIVAITSMIFILLMISPIAFAIDTDGDTVDDSTDNCIFDPNTGQSNIDSDDFGDVCDNCINTVNNDQNDYDSDSIGDACDNDKDGDGINNGIDSCEWTPLAETAGPDGCSCSEKTCDDGNDCTTDTCSNGVCSFDANCITYKGNPGQCTPSEDCCVPLGDRCSRNGECCSAGGQYCGWVFLWKECKSGSDSDDDGVEDSVDQCPNTPNGCDIGNGDNDINASTGCPNRPLSFYIKAGVTESCPDSSVPVAVFASSCLENSLSDTNTQLYVRNPDTVAQPTCNISGTEGWHDIGDNIDYCEFMTPDITGVHDLFGNYTIGTISYSETFYSNFNLLTTCGINSGCSHGGYASTTPAPTVNINAGEYYVSGLNYSICKGTAVNISSNTYIVYCSDGVHGGAINPGLMAWIFGDNPNIQSWITNDHNLFQGGWFRNENEVLNNRPSMYGATGYYWSTNIRWSGGADVPYINDIYDFSNIGTYNIYLDYIYRVCDSPDFVYKPTNLKSYIFKVVESNISIINTTDIYYPTSNTTTYNITNEGDAGDVSIISASCSASSTDFTCATSPSVPLSVPESSNVLMIAEYDISNCYYDLATPIPHTTVPYTSTFTVDYDDAYGLTGGNCPPAQTKQITVSVNIEDDDNSQLACECFTGSTTYWDLSEGEAGKSDIDGSACCCDPRSPNGCDNGIPQYKINESGIDSSDACCSAITDCVYNNKCYDQNWSGDLDGDGHDEICYNATWHDPDSAAKIVPTNLCILNQTISDGTMGELRYYWDFTGSDRGNDTYDSNTLNDVCCQDDSDEHYISTSNKPLQVADGTDACCPDSTNCVIFDTCFTSDTDTSNMDDDGGKSCYNTGLFQGFCGNSKWQISPDESPDACCCISSGYWDNTKKCCDAGDSWTSTDDKWICSNSIASGDYTGNTCDSSLNSLPIDVVITFECDETEIDGTKKWWDGTEWIAPAPEYCGCTQNSDCNTAGDETCIENICVVVKDPVLILDGSTLDFTISIPLGETRDVMLKIRNEMNVTDYIEINIDKTYEISNWAWFKGQENMNPHTKIVSVPPNSDQNIIIEILGGKTGTYTLKIDAESLLTLKEVQKESTVMVIPKINENTGEIVETTSTPGLSWLGFILVMIAGSMIFYRKSNL